MDRIVIKLSHLIVKPLGIIRHIKESSRREKKGHQMSQSLQVEHLATPNHLLPLSLSLLLKLGLDTPLASLSLVVLKLILSLSSVIAREASKGATDGAANAVADALAEIRDLARGLLLLALLVLTRAFGLDALGADEAADRLLCGADGLVPAAVGAVLGFG